MIDFRYHLVSLIAVFLALALGILLGAGPLNQTIGDQLTGQVEDLREASDRLRTDLEVSQTEVANRDAFIDETASVVLGSRLEARTVAVVSLPGAVDDDVADIRLRLEQAGAVVSGEVEITEAWTDPATAAFRSSFAGQLLGYLDPAPGDDASPGVILGTALGQGLTGSDVEGALTSDAQTLLELLSSADEPLVEVVDEPTEAAHATVLVGPRTQGDDSTPEEESTEEDTSDREDRLAVETALAVGLATTGEGSVVSGSAATDLDLVTAIRSSVASSVATVDSVGDVAGRVSVPLALAEVISGTIDHYGFAADASNEVPAAVYLAPPAPPEPDPEPTAGAIDGTGEGEDEDAETTGGDADEAADTDPDPVETATEDAA